MLRRTEAAWLGALVGGEGYLRYRRKKSKVTTKTKVYTYYYWRFQLEIEMAEEEWIKRAAELCEATYRAEPNGRYWQMVIGGSRAVRILKSIQPYLFGLKAKAADIILWIGPNLPGSIARPNLPVLKGRR